MVWKSPLRQHERDGVIEASSSPSKPSFSSPAEIQVREIASKIGIFEGSEILVAVCQQMRKEYVVEAWQLPELDSRQWEKMHAPIGLAVAVKHISTYRLREQEIQRQFQEQHFSKVQHSLQEEEKEEDIPETTCCDRDIFPSSLSGWSLKKEKGKKENEIEAKNTCEDDTFDSKTDDNMMGVEAHPASIGASPISDAKINDEQAVKEKVANMSDTEPHDERNPRTVDIDNALKKNGFIEDCADWLKLVMVATAKDGEENLATENGITNRAEASTPLPKIDDKEDDNHTDVIDSTVKAMSTTIGEVEQENNERIDECDPKITRSFESKAPATPVKTKTADSLERKNLTTSMSIENIQEREAGIKSSNIFEQEIPVAIEKNAKPTQTKTLPFDGKEQENPTQPAKVQTELQESQVDISYTESTERGCLVLPKCEDRSLVGNDTKEGKNGMNKSINVEKHSEKAVDAGEEKEEAPEANSSDSESDVNANIFSGIPNSASFSEDEDDDSLAEKKSSHETTEGTPLSNTGDQEATLVLRTDSDDITVTHSNVSPEGKKSGSNRNKKARLYPFEYDREASTSFEVETFSLQKILVELPSDDHRAILSLLMIMTNARDRVSRTNIAFQVQDSLVALIEKHEIDVDPAKAVQIIFHLSRLKKSYRAIFGKSLFKAMSKLYKESEKGKGKNSPKKKKSKNNAVDHTKLNKNGGGKIQKVVIDGDKNLGDSVQLQV